MLFAQGNEMLMREARHVKDDVHSAFALPQFQTQSAEEVGEALGKTGLFGSFRSMAPEATPGKTATVPCMYTSFMPERRDGRFHMQWCSIYGD